MKVLPQVHRGDERFLKVTVETPGDSQFLRKLGFGQAELVAGPEALVGSEAELKILSYIALQNATPNAK